MKVTEESATAMSEKDSKISSDQWMKWVAEAKG